ncbi:MAG: hypothetical protein K0R40_2660, partial [Burkholderiales bacterium]|nr:hypothetical protein [Burkholderiales bacterium]
MPRATSSLLLILALAAPGPGLAWPE